MENQYETATQFLNDIDEDWANLIATVGSCTLTSNELEPYQALVEAVAGQQLNVKAADSVVRKLIAQFGMFPTPTQLLATSFEDLRRCGLSGRKIEAIKGIASASFSGVVPSLANAQAMTDEELIKQLVSLKGIGCWTVEIFLIFTLGRMDILPIDDFGIVHGYKRLKRLSTAPKRKEMAQIALNFKPHRTVASWYLWRVPKA